MGSLGCGSSPSSSAADARSDGPIVDAAVEDIALDVDVVPSDVVVDSVADVAVDVPGSDAADTVEEPIDVPDTSIAPWDTPDGFGDPGYGASADPLCRPRPVLTGESSPWADSDGVALLSMNRVEREYTLEVVYNAGSGWASTLRTETSVSDVRMRLTGPVLSDRVWVVAPEAIIDVSPTTGDYREHTFDARVVDAVLESTGHGFALVDSVPGLLEFSDGAWSPYAGEPFPADPEDFRAITAVGDAVYAGGINGAVLSARDGVWTVHETNTVEEFSALQGVAVDGLVAGTQSGTIHGFDGAEWTRIDWALAPGRCGSEGEPVRLWGDGDVVYFAAGRSFGRVSDGEAEVIAEWPSTPAGGSCVGGFFVQDLWGNDAGEVFLVGAETSTSSMECAERVVHYTGSSFHWI